MIQVNSEAQFDTAWADQTKVLAIVFDPSATAAANAAAGVEGNSPARLVLWVKDAALASDKRNDPGCGGQFTTCFYCLQRHNVTGLNSTDATGVANNDVAFAEAEIHN